jgi:hypothetical protein
MRSSRFTLSFYLIGPLVFIVAFLFLVCLRSVQCLVACHWIIHPRLALWFAFILKDTVKIWRCFFLIGSGEGDFQSLSNMKAINRVATTFSIYDNKKCSLNVIR